MGRGEPNQGTFGSIHPLLTKIYSKVSLAICTSKIVSSTEFRVPVFLWSFTWTDLLKHLRRLLQGVSLAVKSLMILLKFPEKEDHGRWLSISEW